jgi:hypothetical protein
MSALPSAGLDHIILGIDDLDRGVRLVEQQTGIRATFGGVHPGRGTRNALLSLGSLCYLEIIAPDPEQSAPTWFAPIVNMREPRLVGWVAHTSNLSALAEAAASAGILTDGPHAGARSRPDGRGLRWNTLRLRNDYAGSLPFFIEWSGDSIHPSTDAPAGCTLTGFSLQSPIAAELTKTCQALVLDIPIEQAGEPRMIAQLATPKGEVQLTS